jgi:hypothetical protein
VSGESGSFNSAYTPGPAPPSMAANPTLKAKARMLAPARVVAAVCIEVLPHFICRKAKTIDTRSGFTARLLILILAQIYSAGADFHASIHLSVTS